ncbi:AsmA-like C-terminal region-containing protein [Niveispirillum irakense]|uniref:AsmA family protein n=1 Tax=Niveispirillum irakense TaxID=34011 RepID=UPI0004207671|nr:AsmA-like C-terminal region-containing protein [Niveispirillum irakense]
MRKLLVLVALLVIVAGGGLLLAPSLVPWNQFRDQVAEMLAGLTGRQVVIDGDLALTLLPVPTLTAADVRLVEDGETLASIGSVAMQVRPLPLLSQSIQLESLRLDNADLRVVEDAAGNRHWPIVLDALGQSVQVESLHLADSRLSWERPDQPTVRLEAIGAEITAGGPSGPFELTGDASLGGTPLRLNLTAARRAASGSLPLRASLSVPNGKGEVRFAGVVAPSAKEGRRLEGDLNIQAVDSTPLLGLMRPLLGQPPVDTPELGRALRLTGRLNLDATSIGMDGIDLQWGDSQATGSASLSLTADGTGALVLSFTRFDLDALLANAPPIADWRPAAAMDIDLLADEMRWRGDQMRDVRLLGRWQAPALTLETLAATLPGDMAVSLTGSASLDGDAPRLEGKVDLAATSLRDTLAWAGLDVTSVPVERLRQAKLTGTLAGKPQDMALTDLTGTLDTTRFTGAVTLTRRDRPGLGLRLTLDRLDLDAYRQPGTPGWGERLAPWLREADINLTLEAGHLTLAGLQADGVVLDSAANNGAVTLHNADIQSLSGIALRGTGHYAGSGQPGSHLTLTGSAPTLGPLFRALDIGSSTLADRIGAVTLDARIVGDDSKAALDIRTGLLGGTLHIGGDLLDPAGSPRPALKMRATLPETADLWRLTAPSVQFPPAPWGATDLYGELTAEDDTYVLTALQGSFAGHALTGTVRLTPPPSPPAPDGQPVPPAVEAAAKAPGLAQLAGELTFGALDLDRLLPGLTREDGDIGLDWTRRLNGQVTLAADRLTLAGEEITKARLPFRIGAGLVRLEEGTAEWQGGKAVIAAGLAQMEAGPEGGEAPLTGNLTLTLADAALPAEAAPAATGIGVDGGRFDIRFTGNGEGRNPRQLWSALNGQGKASFRAGALVGIDLSALGARLGEGGTGAIPALRTLTLKGGRTPFTTLGFDFNLADQVAALSAIDMAAPGGTLSGAGAWNLRSRTVDLNLSLTPAVPGKPPAMALAVKGPDGAASRNLDLGAVEAWHKKREAARLAAAEKKAAPAAKPAAPAPKPAAKAVPAPPRNDPVGSILDRLKQQGG